MTLDLWDNESSIYGANKINSLAIVFWTLASFSSKEFEDRQQFWNMMRPHKMLQILFLSLFLPSQFLAFYVCMHLFNLERDRDSTSREGAEGERERES